MSLASHYHGSLVAFEGPQDTISTQLRLLPNSPNILIIPPLRYFIRDDPHPGLPFDARSHILMIHEACNDRINLARTFLRNSTPDNKRLVFMNGGTSSAQVECVSDISKYLTHGDITQAERIFETLVRNGVAGLRRWHDARSASSQTVSASHQSAEQDDEVTDDPAAAAMRAAEALDMETAFLQPNSEVDLTTASRRRSTSVPPYRLADDFQNTAPFYIIGGRRGQEKEPRDSSIPQTPRRSHTTRDSRRDDWQVLDLPGKGTSKFDDRPSSPNRTGEEHSRSQLSLASVDFSSVLSFGFESAPTTPAICEAFAVDVRPSASSASHRHTRSVDRIYSRAIRNQDIMLCSFPQPPRSRPQSIVPDRSNPPVRSKFFSEIPRPGFSTPNRTTVRRSPPTPLKLGKPPQKPTNYVDHGTDPVNNYVDQSTSTEPEPELTHVFRDSLNRGSISLHLESSFEIDPAEPFETVLPMLENLVLLFKGETLDLQLETTIQAFREGIYPINIPPAEPEASEDSDETSYLSPKETRESSHYSQKSVSGGQHAEVTPTYQLNSEEYDPFAYEKYPQPLRPRPAEQGTSSRKPSTPPTPALTPPLAAGRLVKCFHDFTTTNCRTAVGMQNSLRSILKIYFPPEDAGYHQFNFPLLPELSSLWKPVFREADSGTVANRKSKVDLILAIGAQKGVDKDFLGAITGSLEKLGVKPNGVTRSGRLDLRFLIASAMQAFTSQPLANQTQDNPFANPLLLATLIIPHLETYLAAHSATRFLLLEYPAEHLATVLSLQRLIGIDLLRVAGVLDAEIDEPKAIQLPPPTHAHKRSNSKTGKLSASNTTKSGSSKRTESSSYSSSSSTPPQPPFSKANYILTSTATESEIASLISTIWKILIGVSTFYIPEGAAVRSSLQIEHHGGRDKSDGTRHGKLLAQTPLLSTTEQYTPLADAAVMMGFQNGDALSHGEHGEASPRFPSRHRKGDSASKREEDGAPLLKSSRGSVAETIRSSKTMRTMRSQRNRLRHMLGKVSDADGRADGTAVGPSDAGSAYGGFWDDEDDEEEDYGFWAEERKYMPLYGRENVPRKGNSRKALKWLGLAT
ncbi:hypothetical protein GGR52DRAFT_62355 [Hypoxylon sp. FL1284]|nr:hypothetical protein GGR52DRAFT_62355 [Hypoxylon sp. FL1284]